MKNEPDIIQIENLFYSEPYNSEKRLFLSVILQALLDVSKNVITSNDKVNKARAESWFFAEVGVTCENFETVCGMAGVTPSKARSFAYKVIRADNKKFLRNRIRSVLRGDNEKENDV
jgi:hypothetical protein|tara:strand:+ start:337 stop:687 length:351 start_codon:yes stop_codon:yes gene_type:complete